MFKQETTNTRATQLDNPYYKGKTHLQVMCLQDLRILRDGSTISRNIWEKVVSIVLKLMKIRVLPVSIQKLPPLMKPHSLQRVLAYLIRDSQTHFCISTITCQRALTMLAILIKTTIINQRHYLRCLACTMSDIAYQKLDSDDTLFRYTEVAPYR